MCAPPTNDPAIGDRKKRDAEELAAVQAELKEYQHFMNKWMAEQFPKDHWPDFREENYTIAAEAGIAELERQEGL
ncbi:MAG TPA: hypothetical protein VKU02_19905 [Gemmataceae bacterium]|nr:hypothetical protein [Gemmataceae bacterium]